ncbi:hypothetical protein BOTBODRAFT_196348 [Botryobasidium botryosum FD-172 SS1]|uniref:Uncharacterized protein n=1 Tax=Botryobasidium botryosum (strain FD-172 SS1) TaxID=930990 RepID=A0A067N2Q7_BOTB1|nr:hypothetical protein BOTBODRAFT_196348 [Botryobasidium botryosum FD-172 SS1]
MLSDHHSHGHAPPARKFHGGSTSQTVAPLLHHPLASPSWDTAAAADGSPSPSSVSSISFAHLVGPGHTRIIYTFPSSSPSSDERLLAAATAAAVTIGPASGQYGQAAARNDGAMQGRIAEDGDRPFGGPHPLGRVAGRPGPSMALVKHQQDFEVLTSILPTTSSTAPGFERTNFGSSD